MKPAHGLHRYRFRANPEEKRFADAWELRGAPNLEYLLSTDPNNHRQPVSDEAVTVAATVIQWLGSPVGQAFLSDLGYRCDEDSRRRS